MDVVKVIATNFVTHNVKRFVTEKPPGFSFIPGQATDVAINRESLKNELRPFTFTSLNDSPYLEFIIKIYKGRNGITEQLERIQAGDELIVHEPFGTINYQGPGVFIAGGAGITPFIAILRQLKLENKLAGNVLLFANRTEGDIILGDELREMLGKYYINIIEKPEAEVPGKGIDRELLQAFTDTGKKYYYICGPEKFTDAMIGYLEELGVEQSHIIIEQ